MAAFLVNDIVGCRTSLRNHVTWYVGNREKNLADAALGFIELGSDLLLCFLDRGNLGLGLLGFFFFAFFHETANHGSRFVEVSSEIVVFELKRTALIVEVNNVIDGFLTVKPFDSQATDDVVGIGFDLL